MRKPRPPIYYLQRLMLRRQSGLSSSPPIPNTQIVDADDTPITSISERVSAILDLINIPNRPPQNMIFFVMYDIQNNKVRRLVAKYLEQKGCTRIQRSIFLADLDGQTYQTIKADLAEVQSLYDNNDSIIVCPVSTDLLRSMKVIGQQLNLDIIMHNKSTLFI